MISVCYLFALGFLAVARGIPQNYGPAVPILSQTGEVNVDGSYQYSYATGNGITAQERGYLKNPGNPQTEAQVAEGSYQYSAPDGTPVNIRYYSDENGFHAEGAAIPTPPPIPPAIQRALAYIAGQPQGNQFKNYGK